MPAHTMTANELAPPSRLASANGDWQAETAPARVSRKTLWAGRIASALPTLFLLSSGINLMRKADFVMPVLAHLGYPEGAVVGIGLAEFVCALLYAIPQTAFLGAILLTGYLGGATATHVRVGEPFIGPVIAGVLIWAGLFLRDDRLRALVPFRSLRAHS